MNIGSDLQLLPHKGQEADLRISKPNIVFEKPFNPLRFFKYLIWKDGVDPEFYQEPLRLL